MSPRGGKRAGAGAKPIDPDGELRKQISLYLPAALLRELEAVRGAEPRSHLISRVLRDYLERESTPAQ